MTNILDPQLSSPRTLSPTEVTTLRSLLMSQLIISDPNDDDTKDDAENLLDYALDMIGEGENVGHVTDEVSLYLLLVKKRGRGADLFFRVYDYYEMWAHHMHTNLIMCLQSIGISNHKLTHILCVF